MGRACHRHFLADALQPILQVDGHACSRRLGTQDFDSRAATIPYGADPGTNGAAGQDASQRPPLRVKIHAAPGVAYV
jgi:hypothetical protein